MGLFKRILESQYNRGRAFTRSWEGPFDVEFQEEGITQRFERSRDSEAVQQFNDKILAWGNNVTAALGPSISSQGIRGSKLKRSVRNTYKYDYGEIYRIGFAFKREGIFVHKGVGRGYVMRGGAVVKLSKSEGFNRKPKPWFNPVIESNMPELEQIIRDYTDTAIINSTRIYIR